RWGSGTITHYVARSGGRGAGERRHHGGAVHDRAARVCGAGGGHRAELGGAESFLDANVDGVVPAAAGWATDGSEANGEVVCWVLPAGPPGPGAGCPDGTNALQVPAPRTQVQSACAPLLGKSTNSIRARAAAGAGPAAPNNCVLCLLEPTGARALENLGFGDVGVKRGGIVVHRVRTL